MGGFQGKNGPTEPLIVHMVESLDVGGMEKVVAALAREQTPRARVLCVRSGGLVAESLRREGVPVEVFDPRRGGGWACLPFAVRALKALGPFVLHGHGAVRPLARAAGRLAGARAVIHHLHGTEVYGWRQKAFERLFPPNLYIACSEAVRENFLSQVGGAVEVLYNPVDANRFIFNSGVRKSCRDGLGVDEATKVVAMVGRFVHEKGQRILIDSIPEIVRRQAKTCFIFLGDGPLKESCVRQAGAIRADVRFLGVQEDVVPFLNACDIYVQPSMGREGFPVALLEAMSVARPVVAARTQGIPEAVGPAGILIAPGDPKELSRAVIDLMDSSERRERLGSEARLRVETLFSLPTILKRLEALYELAMNPSSGRTA